MAPSATSTPTQTSSDLKKSTKGDKKLIVKLSLPSESLQKFAPAPSQPSRKASRSKSTPSSAPAPAPTPSETPAAPAVNEPSPSDKAEDSAAATPVPNGATPTPNDSLAPPQDPLRKGIPGPKPGAKRKSGAGGGVTSEGMLKPRGKPGPKKKPRLDENGAPILNGNSGPGPSKLGPKANQGAINAHLRALDRSGKPCRKWDKKKIHLKSFTGVQWNVATWRSPKKTVVDANGDLKSESSSTTENKQPQTNGAGASDDKSNSNVDAPTPAEPQQMDIASSPAPVAVS